MSALHEALRLADALSAAIKQVDADDDVIHVARWFVEDAAAELRRLHAECNDLAHQLNESNERNGRLKARRDALLEALREAQACFITQDITRQEYERLYPDAVEETK